LPEEVTARLGFIPSLFRPRGHPLAVHSPSRRISPDLPRNGGVHQAGERAEKSNHTYIHGWGNHFENEAAQRVPDDGSQAGHTNAP